MVVCPLYLVALIKQSGVKDKINALLNQPGHMTMSQLCRITFGFAGNGFNAKLVDLTVGAGG